MTARSHLRHSGIWVDCATPACRQRFHVPLSAADVMALPKSVLYGLLEAFDPPHESLIWAKEWRNVHGVLHRGYDLPATIYADGGMSWAKNGRWHRDGDKPAKIDARGGRIWMQDGAPHRDNDKPAIVYANGTQEWYLNGQIHRSFGPAVLHPDGSEEYWDNGHRLLKGKYALEVNKTA